MIDTAALREKVLDLAIRGKLVPHASVGFINRQTAKPAVPSQTPNQAQAQTQAQPQSQSQEQKPVNFIPTQVKKLEGPKILDKIELPSERKPKAKQPVASSGDDNKGFSKDKKKKRKRIGTEGSVANSEGNNSNNANNNTK